MLNIREWNKQQSLYNLVVDWLHPYLGKIHISVISIACQTESLLVYRISLFAVIWQFLFFCIKSIIINVSLRESECDFEIKFLPILTLTVSLQLIQTIHVARVRIKCKLLVSLSCKHIYVNKNYIFICTKTICDSHPTTTNTNHQLGDAEISKLDGALVLWMWLQASSTTGCPIIQWSEVLFSQLFTGKHPRADVHWIKKLLQSGHGLKRKNRETTMRVS